MIYTETTELVNSGEIRFGLPISNILKFIDTWKIERARYE